MKKSFQDVGANPVESDIKLKNVIQQLKHPLTKLWSVLLITYVKGIKKDQIQIEDANHHYSEKIRKIQIL